MNETIIEIPYNKIVLERRPRAYSKCQKLDTTTILGRGDFVTNIVQKKRSLSSRKRRTSYVGKANSRGNDIGVPPGFRPHLVDCLTFENYCNDFSVDDHYENSDQDCSPMRKHNTLVPSIHEDSNHVSNESIEANMSSDRVCLSKTRGKSSNFSIRKKASSSKKVTAAQIEDKETVEEKGREGNDHEVVVLLKKQYLKNQKELARLARQQEEMLRLMQLREKKDEELRQLLTIVLRNQQAPPSSS